MHRLLVCILVVVSYACADTSIEVMKAGLIRLHESIRNSFRFRGEKLVPFTYSKHLEDLALEWAKTCLKSEPKDPKFANLGNNVGSCPIYWPLLREWSVRLLAQVKAYDPATGECIDSPCEHYRELVQPNNTKFGCAINVCHHSKPKPKSTLLSVCLYQADDLTQQGHFSATITSGSTATNLTMATPAAPGSGTTGSVELSASSELPFLFTSPKLQQIGSDEAVKEGGEEEKVEERFEAEFVSQSGKVFPRLLSLGSIAIAFFS